MKSNQTVASIQVPYVNLPLQMRPIKRELMEAIERVLEEGSYVMGREVRKFEEKFAEYCGVPYAIGVNSGTDALYLSFCALGIGVDDEVITSAHTFPATIASIALTGARPVIVDVREDLNINVHLIEKAITPRTKAILPVHLTGNPADMDPIIAIAKRHNLVVVEDAAQAVGALYRGQKVGGLGKVGCFSLHPLKTFHGFGDGGVITTSDGGLCEHLLKLRNHGMKNRDAIEFWGYNSRLDTIQAALLLVQFNYLDLWTRQRRQIAAEYIDALANLVEVPQETPECQSVYHTFVIKTDRRDELFNHLQCRGVDAKVHYGVPIFQQQAGRSLASNPNDFPVVSRLAKRVLSLPIYPELTDQQKQLVIQAVRSFYG